MGSHLVQYLLSQYLTKSSNNWRAAKETEVGLIFIIAVQVAKLKPVVTWWMNEIGFVIKYTIICVVTPLHTPFSFHYY
jgi:hypothetical protein